MSVSVPSRKRERLRKLLLKPSKPAPGGDLTAFDLRPTSLSHHQSQKFLDDALSALTSEEQATIRKHLESGSNQISAAVEQAYNAALGQKKVCEDKNWQCHYRGRDIVLRAEADKLLLWLDRFKFVGDIVANAFPLHVGLPWAGIRMVLEVTVLDSRQMAALLSGMNLSMYMANRLKVYLEYFIQLPYAIAKTQLKNSLVKMYALVLQFLATAIQTCERSRAGRALNALLFTSDLETFETRCKEWAVQVEIDASNCDRGLIQQDRNSARQWKDALEKKLQNLEETQNVHNSLALLRVKVDLGKLLIAKGAIYNSYADCDSQKCLEDTRTDLLGQIDDWANNPKSKCIFWLSGMAGTGKSTISRTVAYNLDQRRALGASFFFKRGERGRESAGRFFPTIAAQLADTLPELGASMADALDRDSLLCERNLQDQFEKLIFRPLHDVAQSHAPRLGLVIVIDALDECELSTEIRTMLTLLARLESINSFRLRIFVTSRPELPIKLGFKNMPEIFHYDVKLEEFQASTIAHDICAYFKHRFEEIKHEELERQLYEALPADWPGESNIQALVKLAVPLFIFAATVCRYVAESNPERRLESIIQQQQKISFSFSGLEKTYLPILNQLILGKDEQQKEQLLKAFRKVVGPIVLVAEPLSALSLSSLLEIPIRNIGEILRHLHSVLHIPNDRDAKIRLFHLSFGDFLLDGMHPERNPFLINKAATHGQLARQCLRHLNRPGTLRNDICGLQNEWVRRDEVGEERAADLIAIDTAYACSHWVWHLTNSGDRIRDNGPEHEFLKNHFLHWMEVMSWFGEIHIVVDQIDTMRCVLETGHDNQLLRFLDDAGQFLRKARYFIYLFPLQMYSSTLNFPPTRSTDRGISEKDQGTKRARNLLQVPLNCGLKYQNVGKHEKTVQCLAFSPDGTILASGSSDRTVGLWDAATSKELKKLGYHDRAIYSLAFSADGQMLASGSADRTIMLWEVTPRAQTGRKLEGHEHSIVALAFSLDGTLLASAGLDLTIRFWSVTTGQEIRRIDTLEDVISVMMLSRDGSMLALAGTDYTVRLRNAVTGGEMHILKGHIDWATAIAFSPDGLLLASASYDRTIRLWDVQTGKEMNCVDTEIVVQRVSFANGGQFLETDAGCLDLGLHVVSRPNCPVLNDKWIRYQDQNMVPLSYDYMVTCSITNGKLLAIGLFSGAVDFVQVDVN